MRATPAWMDRAVRVLSPLLPDTVLLDITAPDLSMSCAANEDGLGSKQFWDCIGQAYHCWQADQAEFLIKLSLICTYSPQQHQHTRNGCRWSRRACCWSWTTHRLQATCWQLQAGPQQPWWGRMRSCVHVSWKFLHSTSGLWMQWSRARMLTLLSWLVLSGALFLDLGCNCFTNGCTGRLIMHAHGDIFLAAAITELLARHSSLN